MVSEKIEKVDKQIYLINVFNKYFNLFFVIYHSYKGIKKAYFPTEDVLWFFVVDTLIHIVGIIAHFLFYMYSRKAILKQIAELV